MENPTTLLFPMQTRAQIQVLSRHQVVLGDSVPALPKGREEPIPYVSVADPQNVNPYRVTSGRGEATTVCEWNSLLCV